MIPVGRIPIFSDLEDAFRWFLTQHPRVRRASRGRTAIIVLTVLVRLALVPLFVKQMKSSNQMQAIAPEDQGAAGQAQGRPQEAAGRADEALPGALGQPVRRVSAAGLPDADLLRAVPRAARVLEASAGRPAAIDRGDFAFLGSFIPNITIATDKVGCAGHRADRPVRREPGGVDAADAEHDGSAPALHVPCLRPARIWLGLHPRWSRWPRRARGRRPWWPPGAPRPATPAGSA